MDKEAALKKINDGEGDFHVETADERQTFLNNLKDTEEFSQEIAKQLGQAHRKYEDDIDAIYGTTKNQGEKSFAYLKRVGAEAVSSLKDLRGQNETLQKAVNDKSGDKALELLRSENKSLIEKAQKSNDDWKSKYSSLEGQVEAAKVMSELDHAMVGFKFKDEGIIPLDVRNAMVNNAKTELAQAASYIDGKRVYLDADGKVLRDEGLIPLTGEGLMAEKLKSIINGGRKKEGLDIEKKPTEKDKDGKTVVNLSLPSTVTTNVELSGYLLESGLRRGTEDYMAAYEKFRDKVKIVT